MAWGPSAILHVLSDIALTHRVRPAAINPRLLSANRRLTRINRERTAYRAAAKLQTQLTLAWPHSARAQATTKHTDRVSRAILTRVGASVRCQN